MSFDSLLAANRRYAETFTRHGSNGIARAGVAIVTCMDSRIDPLPMVGLGPGDAKILRSAGGWVAPWTMTGLVLAVQLLHVDKIMLVPHTRCAMAGTDEAIHASIAERSGLDSTWLSFGANPDQLTRLRTDVAAVRAHPLIKDHAEVGGFLYDVDTGLLEQLL